MLANYQLITQLDRPLPLTGVNPRSIMGESEWRKVKQKVYRKFNYHCECCGIHKSKAKIHQWLEAHEQYRCDYSLGKCELLDIQPLCYCCHHFLHRKRLKAQLNFGMISKEHYATVIEHGISLCQRFNLKLQVEPQQQAKWEDWRLIYNNLAYRPLFDSKNQMFAYQEWLASLRVSGNDQLLREFKEAWFNKCGS